MRPKRIIRASFRASDRPIFEALSGELKEINFFSVNVDEHPEIPAKFSVMGIPSFILLKDGKETSRIVGFVDKEAFKAKLLQAFK